MDDRPPPSRVEADADELDRADGDEAGRGELVRGRDGGAGAAPMRELALAFRANAEAIEGVRELQADLARTLKRQDRSELVVQSTQALNESFRNLASIQRTLLERLEAGGGRPRTGRLVPLMLIALLVVLLGGIVVVLDVLEQVRSAGPRTTAAAAGGEEVLDAYREGRREGEQATVRELERLEGELRAVAERERALRMRVEDETTSAAELEGQIRALEVEREGLAAQVLAARNEIMAKRALEDEVRRVSSEHAIAVTRLEQLERAMAAEQAENQRLRKRLGALGLGLPDEPSLGAADVAGAGPAPEPPVPVGTAPETPAGRPPPTVVVPDVTEDRALVSRVQRRMNEILDASGRGQGERWQISRIDGVSRRGLHGVTALRYDEQGRLRGQVEAERLVVWVDRDARRVDLEFVEGRVAEEGQARAFPGGVLRRNVADGDVMRLWSNSGMRFLRYR